MNCGVHRIGVAGMKAMPAALESEGGGTSIVECGGYAGGTDDGDTLVYLGSGGAQLSGEKNGKKINMRTSNEKTVDQKDDKTNRAFQYNKGRPDKPVRVVRGTDAGKLSKSVLALGGISAGMRSAFPWNDDGAGVAPRPAKRSAASPAIGASAGAGAVTSCGLPYSFGPYDDGEDAAWLSSYPRAVGGCRELDYFLRKTRGGVQAFRPIGLDKVYRYDGLYTAADWRLDLAPWSTPAAPLKAFYFTFKRLPVGGKQLAAAWSPAGSASERSTIALWEAVIRTRVRAALPLDAIAAHCGVPVPPAAVDAALIDFARSTGGQTDEAYGIWWGGDLRAGLNFALRRGAGEAVELPTLPEDPNLLRLILADTRNAEKWARLRADADIARRAHAWHVVPAAVSAAVEEFSCGITYDFSDEPVTLPCAHNFDAGALETHVRTRAERAQTPNCPLCAAQLDGGAAAWSGDALRAKVNVDLLAAVNALKGVVPPASPRGGSKAASPRKQTSGVTASPKGSPVSAGGRK